MEYRVQFDFEIQFTNGGGISGNGFRLDIDSNHISDAELTDYLLADMQLLMVEKCQILNKKIIVEQHKRNIHKIRPTKYIDLSHTIEHGLVTYKGLPAPIICDFLSRENSKNNYEPGTEFQIGKIEMVSNTGTYIDCPFHRYAHGKDLSEVGIEAFTDLEGLVIQAPYTEGLAVGMAYFEKHDLQNKAILIHTGWAKHWNTPNYYENHPYVTAEAAQYLADKRVKLVGIDSHNIDNTQTKSRPVHTLLLGAEILIVEHLCNLEHIRSAPFEFSAIPPKFKGVGTFPVRAMAKI